MNEIHDMQWLSTASLSMNFVKHFLDYFLNKHRELYRLRLSLL